MDQSPPQAYPPTGYPQFPTPTRDERTWALLSHVLPLPGIWLPFGHVLVPLLIWLLKREESAFIADQAREALNFQISFTLYAFVAGLLSWACVGFVLLAALGVIWFIVAVWAGVRANAGVVYRYPMTLRLVR